MNQSDNSESDSEWRQRTLKGAINNPRTRSQPRKSLENTVHSRMRENRLSYSPRRPSPFSSALQRRASKPLAPSRRSKFAGSYGRDEHSRFVCLHRISGIALILWPQPMFPLSCARVREHTHRSCNERTQGNLERT